MLKKYVVGLCLLMGISGCAMQQPAEVVKVKPIKKMARGPLLEQVQVQVIPGESLTVLAQTPSKTPVKKNTVSENTSYQVKRGDTLYTIARQVGTSVKELGALNNLTAPFRIYEGQQLHLMAQAPEKEIAVPKTLAVKPVDKQTVVAGWHWPTEGNITKQFQPGKKKVNGLVIQNLEGTPVVAAKNGVVVYSGDALRGYGNLIILKHDKNYLSAYAHNRKNIVKEGDNVLRGQRIAEMGKTGSHQVQLHFEIRYQGDPIDPQTVLPRKS